MAPVSPPGDVSDCRSPSPHNNLALFLHGSGPEGGRCRHPPGQRSAPENQIENVAIDSLPAGNRRLTHENQDSEGRTLGFTLF